MYTIGIVGFFDRLPPSPPREPRPRSLRLPWLRPPTVSPGVVADTIVLAHTAEAAVIISGILGYPNGFAFTVNAVLRDDDGFERILGPGMHFPWGRVDEMPPAEFLRLGVVFCGGQTATNLGPPTFLSRSEPAGPVLMPDGGGGGGHNYDMRYWMWPLPPPGQVTFVCQWPAVGIPESHGHIAAEVILQAAARAVILWPDDGSDQRAGSTAPE